MNILRAVTGAALAGCWLAAWGQTQAPCGQALQAAMQPGAALAIDSRPAGLTIVGTDAASIHVTCTASDTEDAQGVVLRLTGSGGERRLKIEGGASHHGGVQIQIEVPRKTALSVKMGAGQVIVKDVQGNDDIDLYAGQVTITSGRWWDYREVHASVDVGQVSAPAYGEDKGGFFRSFDKRSASGEYALRAHVMTGQIELLGSAPGDAAD